LRIRPSPRSLTSGLCRAHTTQPSQKSARICHSLTCAAIAHYTHSTLTRKWTLQGTHHAALPKKCTYMPLLNLYCNCALDPAHTHSQVDSAGHTPRSPHKKVHVYASPKSALQLHIRPSPHSLASGLCRAHTTQLSNTSLIATGAPCCPSASEAPAATPAIDTGGSVGKC